MKLQVLQSDFSKALALTSRITTSRAQLPILGSVLLSTDKSRLNLASTNLEMSVNYSIGAKVEEEGMLAVPGRTASEVIQNIKAGTIELTSEKEKLVVKSEKFEASILGANGEEFPKVPKVLPKERITVNSDVFSTALESVLFSAGSDLGRPVLTGVLFLLEGETLTLVATDGFRLSKKVIPVVNKGGGFKLIVPRLILSEIQRAGSGESEVEIGANIEESQILFGVGDIVMASQILSGEYPNYEKIIPKDNGVKVSLDKEDLLRVVKLAAPFARESANVVKMKVNADSIDITAEGPSVGTQCGQVEARVDGGKELEISFNFHFLEEYLTNAKTAETIEIELGSNNTPGIFRNPKDPNHLHLIMPVKV